MDRGAFENILTISMSMWHMDNKGGCEGVRAQDVTRRRLVLLDLSKRFM